MEGMHAVKMTYQISKALKSIKIHQYTKYTILSKQHLSKKKD